MVLANMNILQILIMGIREFGFKLVVLNLKCNFLEMAFSSFSRFSKLFLVMGVSWTFDILSWSITGLSHRWYWVVFDCINILSKHLD
jgi:hypothetical protein